MPFQIATAPSPASMVLLLGCCGHGLAQLERDLAEPFENTTQPLAELRPVDSGVRAGQHESLRREGLTAPRQVIREQCDRLQRVAKWIAAVPVDQERVVGP